MGWWQKLLSLDFPTCPEPAPIKSPYAVVFACPHCEQENFWGSAPNRAVVRHDVSSVPLPEAIQLLATMGRFLRCLHCDQTVRVDISAQVKPVGIEGKGIARISDPS
jgi:transcription elongation factor Elf1